MKREFYPQLKGDLVFINASEMLQPQPWADPVTGLIHGNYRVQLHPLIVAQPLGTEDLQKLIAQELNVDLVGLGWYEDGKPTKHVLCWTLYAELFGIPGGTAPVLWHTGSSTLAYPLEDLRRGVWSFVGPVCVEGA